MFFLMQNIFIVSAMQHGCRAKPLSLDQTASSLFAFLVQGVITAQGATPPPSLSCIVPRCKAVNPAPN